MKEKDGSNNLLGIPNPISMQIGNMTMFGEHQKKNQISMYDTFVEPNYGDIEIPNPPIEEEPLPPFLGNNKQELDQQPVKYMIFDLFWFLNPKISTGKTLHNGEAHFVVISFNIMFGNLRISFFDLQNNSIQGNVVYLDNLKRNIVGTIYPSSVFNIVNSPKLNMICLEQLFKEIPGAEWQKNRPMCHIDKTDEYIRLGIKDSSGQYYYDFISWQKDAFLHSCRFAITSGFELTGQAQVNKNNNTST